MNMLPAANALSTEYYKPSYPLFSINLTRTPDNVIIITMTSDIEIGIKTSSILI